MSNEKKSTTPKFSPWIIYGLIIAVFAALTFYRNDTFSNPSEISSSKFDELLNAGKIEKIIVNNKVEGQAFLTAAALKDKEFKNIPKEIFGKKNIGPHFFFEIGDIQNFENKINKAVSEKKIKDFDYKTSGSLADYGNLIFIIIMIVFFIFFMRRMASGGTGGAGQIFNIGRSKAKLFDEKADTKKTFKDVAGLEGAKEEIQEIVEFLKNPEKYTNLGAKIPKGALLVGPPGDRKSVV